MAERVDIAHDQTLSSLTMQRRLPPAEAWREPDKWLDLETGLIKPDCKRFYLPTDDRNFVVPDEALKQMQSLFWHDYEWPINNHDSAFKPDKHHFHHKRQDYLPDKHNGSQVPLAFREAWTLIGTMPRQVHNALHDTTYEPLMPKLDDMSEYVQHYSLAKNLARRLFRTALLAVEAQRQFPLRRSDINRHPERIGDRDYDEIGEQILAENFNVHFTNYRQTLEELKESASIALIYPDYERLEKAKPHVAIQTLGKFVTKDAINYLPQFRLKTA